MRTVVGVAIIAALIKPQIVIDAVNGLWLAFQPILGLAIAIAIVVVALRLIVGKK